MFNLYPRITFYTFSLNIVSIKTFSFVRPLFKTLNRASFTLTIAFGQMPLELQTWCLHKSYQTSYLLFSSLLRERKDYWIVFRNENFDQIVGSRCVKLVRFPFSVKLIRFLCVLMSQASLKRGVANSRTSTLWTTILNCSMGQIVHNTILCRILDNFCKDNFYNKWFQKCRTIDWYAHFRSKST